MIRPPSLQHEYTEFWPGDDAFEQPPERPDTQDELELAAYEAACDEHARKVKVARQTGNWELLKIEGREPTKFLLRPIPGHLFRKIVDSVSDGSIGGGEANLLLLQTALIGVSNLPGVKEIKWSSHPQLGKIASVEIPNLLDRTNPAIVADLASVIRSRALGVSPL